MDYLNSPVTGLFVDFFLSYNLTKQKNEIILSVSLRKQFSRDRRLSRGLFAIERDFYISVRLLKRQFSFSRVKNLPETPFPRVVFPVPCRHRRTTRSHVRAFTSDKKYSYNVTIQCVVHDMGKCAGSTAFSTDLSKF